MKTSKPYSGIHTLFTDRVFLSPLYYRDVAAVIDSFKDGEVTEGGTETYEKFKYYIGWKAKIISLTHMN
jgi:hypothetical protein